MTIKTETEQRDKTSSFLFPVIIENKCRIEISLFSLMFVYFNHSHNPRNIQFRNATQRY